MTCCSRIHVLFWYVRCLVAHGELNFDMMNVVFFLTQIKDIQSFKLVEYIRFKYKFAKNKKDKSANKLTASKLIAYNGLLMPTNIVIKLK
jgi:hypothetical protein